MASRIAWGFGALVYINPYEEKSEDIEKPVLRQDVPIIWPI
jgi:hypothetical protein